MIRGPIDHRAAWLACREPDRSRGDRFEPIDLRAKLAAAMQAGWSAQAIKAYAYCNFRYTRHQRDHVTRAAWRIWPSRSLLRAIASVATF
jgi:hypothetical protein